MLFLPDGSPQYSQHLVFILLQVFPSQSTHAALFFILFFSSLASLVLLSTVLCIHSLLIFYSPIPPHPPFLSLFHATPSFPTLFPVTLFLSPSTHLLSPHPYLSCPLSYHPTHISPALFPLIPPISLLPSFLLSHPYLSCLLPSHPISSFLTRSLRSQYSVMKAWLSEIATPSHTHKTFRRSR